MEAVCFKCGHEKSNPLKMCGHCQALPQSRKERIKSMCLSRTCLKTQNLIKASTYIKLKNRPPGFHEKVKVKAAELVDSMPEIGDSTSQSYDFSDSFFDFQELEHGIAGEKITVHAIGKPINDSIDSFNGNNNHNTRTKTYHTLEWEIGKDIDQTEVEIHADSEREIYVWYRWLGNKWVWKCVDRKEFESLRNLEQ